MIDTPGTKATRLLSTGAFLLRGIKFTNNTLFDSETLFAQVADAQGKTLDLSQLAGLAARITDYYRRHGYPLARTIIPAQTIEGGVLRLQVIEPRYGKITLVNKSQIRQSLFQTTLSALKSGNFIEESELDSALLMLSDIPGILVSPSLKRGADSGTSDLWVSASSGPGITGQVGLNNHGNNYTGGENLTGSVILNNPLRPGDTLTFNALTSGAGMNFESMAYDALLNGPGTRLGASTSLLSYAFKTSSKAADALFDNFLDGSGNAKVTSLWLKQTLMRSREKNFYGQLKYDRMALRDHLKVGATGIYTDRHIEALSASFSGDFRDALTSDDITFWSVDPTIGKLAFDDKSAQSFDDISAHTQGNFSKLTSSLLHVKNLDAHRQLFIGFKGQWASTNLDSSQKMAAGGPYSVRAYAAAALAGDQGYLLNAELKQHLGSALNGQWTATAFFDTTAITVNKKPWVASENNATLSGVGLGLIWTGPSQTTGTAYIAKPTGPRSSLVGSVSSVQFSLELQKRF